MTPLDSLERRMAALFVLTLGLIAWQAPRTKPLVSPWYVTVLKPGEQVFPVAVPSGAPLLPPVEPAARLAFLKRHAVDDPAGVPAGSCEGFVRMSAQHWLRIPLSRARLAILPAALRPGSSESFHQLYHLAPDADPTAPITAAELIPAGPGPEVEAFCQP
jgi:hypothetical protein